MKQLLNPSERRQVLAVEILDEQEGWIKLSELANRLDCSVRVLKDDVAYFKNTFKEMSIESSNRGIRLVLHNPLALKIFYRRILADSLAYRLLEHVFLADGLSITDLVELVSVSSSTIYRLIDQINQALRPRGFQVQTNPGRIEGSELNIRHFFYNYFFEKYSPLEWPYSSLNEQTINQLLQHFTVLMEREGDFAAYHVLKTIFAVNLTRVQQGYFIDTSAVSVDFSEITSHLATPTEPVRAFEEAHQLKVDSPFLQQVLGLHLPKDFFVCYDRLTEKKKENKQLSLELDTLSEMLNDLSKTHRLPLKNKEEVLLNTYHAAHLAFFDPRFGFVLYNYDKRFMLNIKKEFPAFYKNLHHLTSSFLKVADKPLTDAGINFIMSVIFATWDNLAPELCKKRKKIHMLVMNDRHYTHSKMVKDVLLHEFNEQITVDIYREAKLDQAILKGLPYDIIVANFPLPALNAPCIVYAENLPLPGDLAKIRETMDAILLERTR